MAQIMTQRTMTDKEIDTQLKSVRREVSNCRTLGLDNLLITAKKKLAFLESQRMLPHEKRATYRDLINFGK